MKKKNKNFTILILCVLLVPSLSYPLIGIENNTNDTSINPSPKAADGLDPIIDYEELENGTKQTTIDYQNGTQDIILETTVVTYSQMQLGENETDQYLIVETPTSILNCTDWIPMEQKIELRQDILMGFTYTILRYRRVLVDIRINLWLVKGYVRAGINIDIQFGLRLPFKIILEYPEQMTINKNYEFYATLVPLDKDGINFKEFLFTFQCYAYIQAGVWAPFVGWTRWSYVFGPNYDYSRSFTSPLGTGLKFPIPDLGFTIWNLWLMRLDIRMRPYLTSDKVTARATASGDASCNYPLKWTGVNQRKPFTVHAGDFSGSDKARIKLSDFRYYFSQFWVDFFLDVNFDSLLSFVSDMHFKIYTLDLSWLMPGLYMGVHSGTISYVKVDLFVEKLGVDLTSTPTKLQVLGGEVGEFELKVKNTGNVIDTFRLYLEGCTLNYWFSEDEITLEPGETRTIILSIQQGETPSKVDFYVHAYSLKDEEIGDTTSGTIEVLPFYMVDVSMIPISHQTKPGTTVQYDIEVKNTGNIDDCYDISLECVNFDSSWATLDVSYIVLGPTETGYATVQVTVPNDWTGMVNVIYNFNVIANGVEANDEANGILIVEATKESKARYINKELLVLTNDVINAPIGLELKDSILDHLIAATDKKDQALNYIIEGRNNLANNMLRPCKNMLNAMISLIYAQTQNIPEPFAGEWICATDLIIDHIIDTIKSPL